MAPMTKANPRSDAIDFAIIGAMEAEVVEVLRHAVVLNEETWSQFVLYHVTLFGRRCVVIRCGVGKVFAAMVTQFLIDTYHPRHILFTGVAGCLNPEYDIGDVVISRDLVQHDVDGRALGFSRGQLLYTDFKVFSADADLIHRAMQAELEGPNLYLGRILTGDQFMSRETVSSHEYLTGEMAGDAVEMEGAAMAQVCHLQQIPFLVVRTLSDRANGEAVHDFTAFLPVVARNSYAVLRAVLSHGN
jgi:adenosylhomocysteine nucleosidase